MEKLSLPNKILFSEVSQELNNGNDVVINTKGNSMLPFIKGEIDRVRLRRMSHFSDYDVVLALLADGRYVLHRIIDIDGDNLTLMGDGNLLGQEHCQKIDILGTAIAVIHPDDSETDLFSPRSQKRARLWRRLLPFRRYILGIYRRVVKLA